VKCNITSKMQTNHAVAALAIDNVKALYTYYIGTSAFYAVVR